MVTKEQAMVYKSFIQIYSYPTNYIQAVSGNINKVDVITSTGVSERLIQLDKPAKWRANGKCKTWKREPERFQLPIKHGLYSYGYITNENAHLFIVDET